MFVIINEWLLFLDRGGCYLLGYYSTTNSSSSSSWLLFAFVFFMLHARSYIWLLWFYYVTLLLVFSRPASGFFFLYLHFMIPRNFLFAFLIVRKFVFCFTEPFISVFPRNCSYWVLSRNFFIELSFVVDASRILLNQSFNISWEQWA